MNCPREEREQAEYLLVGNYGVRAVDSRGREMPEEECSIRTCFQRDVDRITHCKSFRRLKHKTQVFLQPEGDHYRTRLTHTLEVSRLARTVSHPGGFRHYEQSLRVADLLERDGRGLNLCYETRMGILNHTYGAPDDTREATCVRLCDRIAYINHDLDDAIRAGLLTEEDVPEKIRSGAGSRNSARINSFIRDLIMSSGNGALALSEPMQDLFDYFHSFMYAEIYTNPLAKGEEGKVDGILAALYDYYTAHPETLPEDYLGILENEGVERAACDYISGDGAIVVDGDGSGTVIIFR